MNNLIKKGVVVSVILLFVSVSVIPSSGTNVVERTSTMSFDGNTLYVGGSGPGNYTKIQDAIDNASDGDTVFVFDNSSPYYENVVVNKSVALLGEDRDTTVIDGMGIRDNNPVTITASKVILSGFTIQNATSANTYGIEIVDSNEIRIIDNIFTNNYFGIDISGNEIIISNNKITNIEKWGIIISGSDNLITNNIIDNSGVGISAWFCENNTITYNDISNILTGIIFERCNNNTVSYNNIYKYKIGGQFHDSFGNSWNSNYWGRPRILPKIIFGTRLIYLFKIPVGWDDWLYIYLPLPMIDFDRHPAQEPYDIGV